MADAVEVLSINHDDNNLQDQAASEKRDHLITPRVGTMIDLPDFEKACNIRHCCSLLNSSSVSVERKYDGEYCRIHVSIADDGEHQIKIFSKSGRDSTKDRQLLSSTIERCLRLAAAGCRFQSRCILVGELLVWNEHMDQIMPLCKIRRHVTRAGRRLSCAQDSPASIDEHLMLVFHDLLLSDDDDCVYKSYKYRRVRLETLIQKIPGHAVLGHRDIMHLRDSSAEVVLARKMADAIAQGWEELVLKRCHDPYLTRDGDVQQHVKLKKDYIAELGDSVDLVVVGDRRVASDVYDHYLGNLSWTIFYLSCLANKETRINPDTTPSISHHWSGMSSCGVSQICPAFKQLRQVLSDTLFAMSEGNGGPEPFEQMCVTDTSLHTTSSGGCDLSWL